MLLCLKIFCIVNSFLFDHQIACKYFLVTPVIYHLICHYFLYKNGRRLKHSLIYLIWCREDSRFDTYHNSLELLYLPLKGIMEPCAIK